MVIDYVEGTAMEALPFMENIVNNKPETFPSIEKGIEYILEVVLLKIYKVLKSVFHPY